MPSITVLRHVVLFAFKPDASPAQCGEISAEFAALPSRIPGIIDFEYGVNVSPEGLNDDFSHCFMLSFGTTADRDAYLVHPAHQAFVAKLGTCLAKSLVIDYWTGDPA
jgi:hypothetical protein